MHRSPHRLEVIQRELHIGKHLVKVGIEIADLVFIELLIELDMLHRLAPLGMSGVDDIDQSTVVVSHGADDRMEEPSNAKTSPRQGVGYRIHQERAVVGNDLDDRARGVIAVNVRVGIEDPHRHRIEAALIHEVEDIVDLGEQLLGWDRRQLILRKAPHVGLGESGKSGGLAVGNVTRDMIEKELADR
jgi:hypothetical protein